MIMDDKSLEIGVYEHFKDYFNTRGVGIITDKQFVLYTQNNMYDGFNHDSAMPYLDKKIYPYKHYEGFYRNSKDISFASMSEDLYFFMPDNDYISKNQYQFLLYMLKEIERYNNQADERKKVTIHIYGKTNDMSISSSDIDDVKQFISRISIRNIISEKEEIIIGKTLNDINAYTRMLDESQRQLLNGFGISTDNIPESMLSEFERFKLSSLENAYFQAIGVSELDEETMEFQEVCIKDITGTTHPDYRDKSIIESFSSLKRGAAIIQKQQENPEYYTSVLKDKNRQIIDEVTVVEKDGKYYITQGNNRLITQLVSYLSEKQYVFEDSQKLKELDDKYTFYLKCLNIPKDIDEMILITFIKDFEKNVIIKKNNKNDALYTITIEEHEYTLKNMEEIRAFVNNLFNVRILKEDIEKKLAKFIFKYHGDSDFKKCMENMEITQKFFQLRELKNRKSIALDEMLSTIDDEISYGELLTTLEQKETDLFKYYVQKIKEIKSEEGLYVIKLEIEMSNLNKDELQKLSNLMAEKKQELEEMHQTTKKSQIPSLNNENNSDIINSSTEENSSVDMQITNDSVEEVAIENKDEKTIEHELLMTRYKELMEQGYRPDHAEKIARLVVREEMKKQDKAEQMVEAMANGQIDINGQPIIQNQEIISNNRTMGFAKAWVLGILTTIASIGIIIIGVILNK